MSDADIRTLERRVREGGDDLDHARLFSALWKRGEADLYTFITSFVYNGVSTLSATIEIKSRPESLRVPVVVTARAKGWRFMRGSGNLYFQAVSAKQPDAEIISWTSVVPFDAAAGEVSLSDDGRAIRMMSNQIVTAHTLVKAPEPVEDLEYLFFFETRPMELSEWGHLTARSSGEI